MNENPAVQLPADAKFLREASLRRWDMLFDMMLKTSSGTLALSVTFRKSIAGDSPTAVWLLIGAWVAFALVPFLYCFLLLIQGTLFSQVLQEQLPLPLSREEMMSPAVEKLGDAHGWVSVVLASCFFIGLVMFTSFAVINV